MKTVLLITDSNENYYYRQFLEACTDLPIRLCLFFTDEYPESRTLSLSMTPDGQISGDIDVDIYLERRLQLPLEAIDVGWYLRASKPVTHHKTALERRFAEGEARVALSSLCATLRCRWINSKEATEKVGGDKVYQQSVAARCGLRVPRTIMTNDVTGLNDLSMCQDTLLVKTLCPSQLDEGGRFVIYSQQFHREELASSAAAVRRCPLLVQEYIEKKFEYRVMAIAGTVLACRIHSQASEKTRIDWRHYDFDNVKHERVELPRDVVSRILHFMTDVGLDYGALDLIETPDGDFVFLEINPEGQWDWIAQLAQLPIAEAVANMLVSK